MALWRDPEEREPILDEGTLLQGMDKLREEVRKRDLVISQKNEEIAKLTAELEELRRTAK